MFSNVCALVPWCIQPNTSKHMFKHIKAHTGADFWEFLTGGRLVEARGGFYVPCKPRWEWVLRRREGGREEDRKG